jgi:hypothetical protein
MQVFMTMHNGLSLADLPPGSKGLLKQCATAELLAWLLESIPIVSCGACRIPGAGLHVVLDASCMCALCHLICHKAYTLTTLVELQPPLSRRIPILWSRGTGVGNRDYACNRQCATVPVTVAATGTDNAPL